MRSSTFRVLGLGRTAGYLTRQAAATQPSLRTTYPLSKIFRPSLRLGYVVMACNDFMSSNHEKSVWQYNMNELVVSNSSLVWGKAV